MKVGTRIKLKSPLVNKDSNWMPVENIPVGTLGTVTWIGNTKHQQIGVKWDNGSTLCLLPHDQYEIIIPQIETNLER